MPHIEITDPAYYLYPNGQLDPAIVSQEAVAACIHDAELCCDPDENPEGFAAFVYACALGKVLFTFPTRHVTQTSVTREGSVRRDSITDIYPLLKERWKFWRQRACDLGCCCGLIDPDDQALARWPHVISLR